VALKTSYEGFVYDGPKAKSDDGHTIFAHDKIRNALQTMEKANIFRTDVTQPFGLGTKCARTYVTRCLLGERGTTYKYLGLRMFSHPWDAGDVSDKALRDALRTIAELNDNLTDRTETHLSALDEKRRERGVPQPTTKGRAKFDISLINRMVTSEDLKPEPMTSKGRCTVSWHADSCLEHYSTIGVYHTLFEDSANHNDGQGAEKSEPDGSGWSVALRVAHDSEGPAASSRGADIDVVTETPVISTSLPSGAAYYLLDDFNHHHQHAVLAPDSQTGGVRFSSTHRLLRLGHNVSFVIERCRTTCAGFHKKGPKVWRSEQLLLTDTESEWIHQFYIQGSGHKANLWPYWREPMCELLKYWSQLESRTKQIFDLLKFAAEERCGIDASGSDLAGPNRAKRKLREKRRKAGTAVSEILGRNDDTCDALYETMADLLEERAKMRSLWAERAKDKVFKRMDFEYKPLSAPFLFEVSDEGKTNEEDVGRSPLVGSPQGLQRLAANLRYLGKAYRSKKAADLPKIDGSKQSSEQKCHAGNNNHSKNLTWEGWGLSDKKFGLEMQDPWARALLSGEKKIETRAYDLPPALVGKQILILESKAGKAGVSSLGDVISSEDGIEKYVRVLGHAVFDEVVEYKDRDSFEKDENLHLVTRGSGYGWKDGKTEVIYGWVCSSLKLYSDREEEVAKVGALVRRMRSLYQVQPKRMESVSGASPHTCSPRKAKKKKKKRKNESATKQGMPKGGGSVLGQKKKKRRY
jgi:alpha-ketoglutarate-dependent dioxygenase FTO